MLAVQMMKSIYDTQNKSAKFTKIMRGSLSGTSGREWVYETGNGKIGTTEDNRVS